MNCPSCRHAQKDGLEKCQNCGLVFERWSALQARLREIGPPAKPSVAPPSDSLSERADAYYREGQIEEALENYARLLKRFPDRSVDWNRRGCCEMGLGRYAEALASFEESLRLNPGYAYAWNNKGMCFNQLGKYLDAIACFDRAIALETFAYPHYYKSISMDYLGRYQDMLKCLNEALQIITDFDLAWYQKAVAEMLLGDFKAAERSLTEYLKVADPDDRERQEKAKDMIRECREKIKKLS